MTHLLIKQLGPLQSGRAKLSRLLTTGKGLNSQTRPTTVAKENDDLKVGKRVNFIEELKIEPYNSKHQATGKEHLHPERDLFMTPLRAAQENSRFIKATTGPDLTVNPSKKHLPSSKRTSLMDSVCGFDLFSAQNKDDAADLGQLDRIAAIMTTHIPRFFNQPHPFNLYTKDVVFIDNIRSVRIQGTSQYAIRLASIKLYYALRYSNHTVEILNLVKLPEESCIKIRWRIIARPGLAQFLIHTFKFHSTQIWQDGISTLHVNKDGKIYCHVVDNIDIDQEGAKIKKVKNPIIDRGLSV